LLAASVIALGGCGTGVPDVPDAGELDDIRGALLDSYTADRFGAAVDDLNGRVGPRAKLLRVEVIPTHIGFDVFEGGEEATTYIYNGQGEFERTSVLRFPDRRKAYPISAVHGDAPERIWAAIERDTGLTDLKFNSAYLAVDIFERERGPTWSEGGGNSAGQSVSYSATPAGALIEQIGGTFESPGPKGG
jgi:hypothetical protein